MNPAFVHIAATDPSPIDTLVVPAVVAVIASGLLTAFLTRHYASRDRRRDGYAEASAAVQAWHEYAYRIRRRTSNDPAVLSALALQGHDLQERLAAASAWIRADNRKAANAYDAYVAAVKRSTAAAINEAWTKSPVSQAEGMNLGTWGPKVDEAARQAFLGAIPRWGG